MEKEVKKRRKPIENKPNSVKSISFSGDEGYEALRILNENNHTLGNSGLIIDLLRIYDSYKNIIGLTSDDEAIQSLKVKLGVSI